MAPQVVWRNLAPRAVIDEVSEGQKRGYDVPLLKSYEWLKVIKSSSVPSDWLSLDLGAGELETMALALENPERVAILDDALARRIAQAAGLNVWGTLKVLLEAKEQGITKSISPHVEQLKSSGMWISEDIRLRIFALAGE
jgi:predicted nucleic acid-binding protein